MIEKPFRLSRQQERMWFLEKISPNPALYNNPSVLRIDGPLDFTQLERACREVIDRHEQLRVCIREVNDRTWQFPVLTGSFHLQIIDLERNPNQVHRTVQSLVLRRFDFSTGPLYHFSLIRLSDISHLFVINLHHLISDGWSKSILLKQIFELYIQRPIISKGRSMGTYRDYIDAGERDGIYHRWTDIYPKTIGPLQIPVDRAYPDRQDGRGALISFELTQDVSAAIFSLAKAQNTTTFTLLLALFAVCLYRWTGQREFAIGVPVSGRVKRQWEEVIGLFVNTVAVPISIDPNDDFANFLNRIKNSVTQILAVQHVPFDELIKVINPVRDIKRNPLFQVMFQYDNFPLPSLALGDLQITPEVIDFGIAQLDISLTVWQLTGQLRGTLEYRTDILNKSTVQRFRNYFTTLLESAVRKPHERISALAFIPEEELKRLAHRNRTAKPLAHTTFLTYFENACNSYPNYVAIRTGNEVINYRDLAEKSDQLADALTEKGARAGSRVSILIPRSIDLIIAVIGVAKAGLLFCIIDPDYPINRQRQLMEAFSPDFHLSLQISSIQDSPDHDLAGDNEFCVVFTSGTTGTPKGVILGQMAIANIIDSFVSSYDVSPNDRVLSLSSISFASFLGEVLPTLCAGAQLVLADRETLLDENLLLRLIEQAGVTILSTVPSFIRVLNERGYQPAGLRFLLSGGEVLNERDFRNFKSPLKIVNGYGLTEGTICSSFQVIDLAKTFVASEMTLGKPISNTYLLVLDENSQVAPVGYRGEIVIGGMGLMMGYLDDPKSTQSAFVSHPDTGEPLLKTGDQGAWLPSWEIRYLGRLDLQVKIRGYRVSPLEITQKILESGLVESASVKVVSEDEGAEVIAAVCPTKTLEFSSVQLRRWLSSQLPDYMIPTHIVILEHLPLDHHGKVNWNSILVALPEQQHQILAHPPLTLSHWEKQLTDIWSVVLKKADVDPTQNFFDLGGHSILLMQVHRKLREVTQRQIGIIDLFRFPTIRSLASFLQEGGDLENSKSPQDRASKQKEAVRASKFRK